MTSEMELEDAYVLIEHLEQDISALQEALVDAEREIGSLQSEIGYLQSIGGDRW